jgi:hypothetical protein
MHLSRYSCNQCLPKYPFSIFDRARFGTCHDHMIDCPEPCYGCLVLETPFTSRYYVSMQQVGHTRRRILHFTTRYSVRKQFRSDIIWMPPGIGDWTINIHFPCGFGTSTCPGTPILPGTWESHFHHCITYFVFSVAFLLSLCKVPLPDIWVVLTGHHLYACLDIHESFF